VNFSLKIHIYARQKKNPAGTPMKHSINILNTVLIMMDRHESREKLPLSGSTSCPSYFYKKTMKEVK
jgi:hypothetical protein